MMSQWRRGRTSVGLSRTGVFAVLATCLSVLVFHFSATPVSAATEAAADGRAGILKRLIDRLSQHYAAPPPTVLVPVIREQSPEIISAFDTIPDGDELIMELRIGDLIVSDTIIGKKSGRTIMLPLAELTNALSFAIEVNPVQGRAEGWFIRETRRFQLDVRARQAIVDGMVYPFPENAIESRETDIYVSHVLLNSWFGLGLEPDPVNLAVVASPIEPLPIQERLQREQRQQGGSGVEMANTSTLSLKPTPNALIDWPVLDVTVAQRLSKRPSTPINVSADYAIQGSADLAYFGAGFFATGEPVSAGRETLVSQFRGTLVREDYDDLFPLGITRVELGEIRPVNAPLIGAGFERGLFLSNEPLGQISRFDTVDITGEALPGWDADLFQNGVLVASQRVGPNGRYLFDDRDLFIGDNEFKVVLYGPQGQVREEVRRIPLGAGLTTLGATPWSLSISQRDMPIYDRNFIRADDQGGLRIVGSLGYGLSRNFSLTGAFQHVDVGARTINALQTGAVAQIGPALVSSSVATATGGGYALTASAQGGIGRERIYLNYGRSDGLFDSKLAQNASLSLSGARIRGRSSFSYGTSLGYTETADNEVLSAGIRGGLTIPGYSLLGSLTAQRSANEGDSLKGQVQGYTRIGRLLIRANAGADLYPEFDLNSVGLSTNIPLRLLDQLSVNIGYEPITGNYQFSAFYDLSGRLFRLGPSLTYSSDGSIGVGLVAGASLYRHPGSGDLRLAETTNEAFARVAIRILEDTNQNGQVDDDDRPMEGVAVRIIPGDIVSAPTDKSGATLISDLPPGQPIDVLLDDFSLPDPFQRQVGEGFSVRPRKGAVPGVDILVGMTDEVYGTVLAEDRMGNPQPVNGVRIRLVPERGGRPIVASSDSQGSAFLGNLHRGVYLISVDEADAKRLGGTAPPVTMFEVPATGRVVNIPALTISRKHRGYFLAIGNTQSELGRLASLMVLRKRLPSILEELPLHVPEDGGGESLLLGPVPTLEKADTYCKQIREIGRECSPV